MGMVRMDALCRGRGRWGCAEGGKAGRGGQGEARLDVGRKAEAGDGDGSGRRFEVARAARVLGGRAGCRRSADRTGFAGTSMVCLVRTSLCAHVRSSLHPTRRARVRRWGGVSVSACDAPHLSGGSVGRSDGQCGHERRRCSAWRQNVTVGAFVSVGPGCCRVRWCRPRSRRGGRGLRGSGVLGTARRACVHRCRCGPRCAGGGRRRAPPARRAPAG